MKARPTAHQSGDCRPPADQANLGGERLARRDSAARYDRRRRCCRRSDQRDGRRLRRSLGRRALRGDAGTDNDGLGIDRATRSGGLCHTAPGTGEWIAEPVGTHHHPGDWDAVQGAAIRALGSGAGRDRCQPQRCRSSLVGEPLRQTPNTGYRAPGWWEHRPRPKLTPLLSSRIARARRTPGPRSGAGRYPAPLHPPD